MPWLSYESSLLRRGTGLFTTCYKSSWALSPKFLQCGATCYKCSCNLGLCFTLWDTETRETVLPCWYSCLSTVLWGTNCLALITVSLSTSGNYIVMTSQPLVCLVISFGISLLFVICSEVGVLHQPWALFFSIIILFWFWALTNTIAPPKMSSPRDSCRLIARFGTWKGLMLALVLFFLSRLSLKIILHCPFSSFHHFPFLDLALVAAQSCSCPIEIIPILILKGLVGKKAKVKQIYLFMRQKSWLWF